jgi:hypothetical protein
MLLALVTVTSKLKQYRWQKHKQQPVSRYGNRHFFRHLD